MPKVIATDLDGTLFYPKDKKNIISKDYLFFLQSFIDNGGELVLISGRSFNYCKKVIDVIGRKVSVVAYNGACIYDGEKLIRQNVLDNATIKQMIDEVNSAYKVPGIFLMTEEGIAVHFKHDTKLFRWLATLYYKNQKNLGEKIFDGEQAYIDELDHGTVYKFMYFFGLGKKNWARAKEATTILRNEYENLECNWSDTVIEVTSGGVYKAEGLKFLCDHLGYNKDDVYVVGDSGNDISMFKAFPEHSFCMAHSHPAVKKHAKYIIDKFKDLSRYIS